MKPVRARLGNDVHHRPGIPTIFGIERVGQHAKLLDAVWAGLNRRKIYELIVGVAAVHAEVVGASAATID